MVGRRAGLWSCAVLAAVILQGDRALLGQATAPARPYTTWRDYGGSADSMQYSALSQVNKSNVTQAVDVGNRSSQVFLRTTVRRSNMRVADKNKAERFCLRKGNRSSYYK